MRSLQQRNDIAVSSYTSHPNNRIHSSRMTCSGVLEWVVSKFILIFPRSISFYMLFSSARQATEHMSGILKGRVSSLKGIRTQLKKKSSDE